MIGQVLSDNVVGACRTRVEDVSESVRPMTDHTGATGPNATAPSSPFATLSLEHSSTVDRVAEELRRALFDGEVAPGTPLREIALADAMGVSRSTIREALGLLEPPQQVEDRINTRHVNFKLVVQSDHPLHISELLTLNTRRGLFL